MKTKVNLEAILPPLLGGVVTLIIILLMNRDYPFVGHDYRFFIVRLIDTDLHIRLHGLSIQWYTPSFAGGLPAFPNPQHLEYSIVQGLTFLSDPWSAILITTALVSFVGYWSCYHFLRDRLELSYMAATLGALFFLGNGFYIEHMIVGHVGFQLFPLSALILWLLTDIKRKLLLNAVATALLIATIVYHAGFIIVIIIAMSFAVTLPIIHLYRPESFRPKQLLLTSALALILAVGITSSKLYAVSAFMQHFPRQISDQYNVSLPQGLVGIIAQLLGIMTLAPVALIRGTDTDLLSGALYNITGAEYGIWELDTALSPVLLFFLFYGLAKWSATIRKSGMAKLTNEKVVTILLLVVAIWVNLEMTLAKGLIYSVTKYLPILASLHVNVRFTAAFILPLTILGAIQAEPFLAGKRSIRNFLFLSVVTVLSLTSYFVLSSDLHSRYLDISPLKTIDKQIESGNAFPIQQILDIPDLDVFLRSASSFRTYEVLFGYSLESFTPETHPGSVFDVYNGYFNMTNPAGLVFPEINNTYPFERIRVEDRHKLEVFLQRGQPDWKIPLMQKYLNYLSPALLVVCLGVLLAHLISRIQTKE